MKKKGLVIIYDPHALMQFLQFYCMDNHSDIVWDVLCLPKDDGKQEMDGFCEKSGVFNKIYKSDVEFKSLSTVSKLKLFIPMLVYGLFGQQKKMCVKIFNSMVDNIEAYDYYAANTESGFMAGLMASFAPEKTTVYFEDGSADYMITRKKNQSTYKKGSFMNFQCILMAKLGYFGKGYTYFEKTKNCYKYASVPEELSYKNYKKIFRFALSPEQNSKYQSILQMIYPELKSYENISTDCSIAFTIPVDSANVFKEKYIQKYEEYISTNAKEIFLKKHPRDNSNYTFSDSLICHEIPQDIPAELLFSYFQGRQCFMMEPDSLLLNMSPFNIFITVLHYKEYEEEQSRLYDFSFSREASEEYCKRFAGKRYKIVQI